ncbi:BrxE family protein [Mesorhizobium sp. CO1-1-7]|uniref:BrxE family protein n=1 Tax=Mesorhizobium sp. CO1-1-7 TaxID=2876632 RepID=UPI001CD0B1F6|nr:BrxE family protein [Mesorhizobium sp. CO1-1-7]MBZ9746801.1 BrxE family protein [Mesorhizobium sp. CO1-1-7]
MRESHLSTLLHTRLLVAYLGERAQFAWWPTAFYEPSGRLFLEPVFPRTSRVAQYHGVVEAARRLHDEHLSVGSYHLFRMPEEVEQDLHGLMQSGPDQAPASNALRDKEAALDALSTLAGANAPDGVGPILIGNVRDVSSASVVEAIAAIYRAAFSRNAKAYPYLVR